jgi:REP element-mobilizing transposase RayT
MNNESNIRRDQHCVFTLHVYLILVAKDRRRVFDTQAIDVLRGLFAEVCSDAHATLVQMDGEDDPVHLLVEYPPKVAVASLVRMRVCLNGRKAGAMVACVDGDGAESAAKAFGATGLPGAEGSSPK